MAWTTYIVEIEDLRYLFSRAEQNYGHIHPILEDYIRESIYEHLVTESLQRVIANRVNHPKPIYLRKTTLWVDLGAVYYDYVGYEYEVRMAEILNSRMIHYTDGEILKTMVAGNTLFITKKNHHLR